MSNDITATLQERGKRYAGYAQLVADRLTLEQGEQP